MIRRPPRSTLDRSSAASDVYKRQHQDGRARQRDRAAHLERDMDLSLIHISEPTRLLSISYAVFCLKKKKKPRGDEAGRDVEVDDVRQPDRQEGRAEDE